MRIDDIQPQEIPFNVKVPGGIITGAFDKSKMTPKLWEKVGSTPETFLWASVCEMLVCVLVRWDLLIDKENMYPITVENLIELPMPVLTSILEAMVAAMSGKPPICME